MYEEYAFMGEKYTFQLGVWVVCGIMCGEPKYVCEFYLCETFLCRFRFSSSISNEMHNNKKKFSMAK